MRLALVHNLKTRDTEAQAEFDSPATIAALAAMLRRLGHSVTPIDVSHELGQAIAELELLVPDLVFNTAEGQGGPLREAVFPALFEELGLAYTGCDPVACALTLDKHRTKAVVAAAGIPTPHALLIEDPAELAEIPLSSWPVPAIVKPNFEGSSKGVTAKSITHDPREIPGLVAALLARFDAGVLVEAFIPGRDVTVPWLETVGALPAAEYLFADASADTEGPDQIYGYTLKQDDHAVSVRTPARLDARVARDLAWMSERIVAALGVRDLARLDFRVTEAGEVWFLELNALPSLEPGASLYESAALVGLREPAEVLGAVIASALRRQPVTRAQRPPRSRRPRIGLVYNLRRVDPRLGDDREAEFDSRETISAVHEALDRIGLEVVELEASAELVRTLPRAKLDLAFNIAEGSRGRGREAQVPALLELVGLPFTGSDAVTMALTLDKTLAKAVVAAAGVATPSWALLRRPSDPLPTNLSYPLFVKPAAEGSSKGIDEGAIVGDERALRARVKVLFARYDQPVLVESYLPGREFTVGIVEGLDPMVLPPMEIVHASSEKPTLYGYASKLASLDTISYEVPAKVSPALDQSLREAALAAFRALDCRDVARIDLRLDAHGAVSFMECNPLPGLSPGWSDLCMIASAAGLDYDELIAALVQPALTRAGFGPHASARGPHERVC